jgi:hypothetical protein
MNPEYSPAIFHLTDTKFPSQIVPFGVIDGRNTRALRNSKVVDKYRVANPHLIKGIPAKGGHFHPRLRGINGESGIQHRGAPALMSLKDRHERGNL